MRWLLPGLLLLLVGCGDPLADASFQGDSLFTFSGQISSVQSLSGGERDAHVSVFWATDLQATTLHEHPSTSVDVSFPSTFEIHLFHPPADAHLIAGGAYAIGIVQVYDDRDHDGVFGTGDEVMGGAPTKAIIYAPQDLTAEASATGGSVPRGYHLLTLPLPCDDPFWAEDAFVEGFGDCGTPLGEPCESHAACGTGECLQEVGLTTFEGGYCALPVHSTACTPDGVWLGLEDELASGEWWFAGCDTNSDCRVDQGYGCDPLIRACLPEEPIYLELAEWWETPGLCISDDGWFIIDE